MYRSVRTLTRVALFCALIAVCSLLSVPSDPPFTLQTFAVFFCVGVLGGRQASLAVLCYLLLGAAGLPVFAGFRGGIAQLIGTTGGYLIGFLPAVLVTGALPGKLPLFLRMLCGLAVCYAFGTAWYFVWYLPTAGAAGFLAALLHCVVPFVPFDLAKLFLASKISKAVKRRFSEA